MLNASGNFPVNNQSNKYTMSFSAYMKKKIRKHSGVSGRVTNKIAKAKGYQSSDHFYQSVFSKMQSDKKEIKTIKNKKRTETKRESYHVSVMLESLDSRDGKGCKKEAVRECFPFTSTISSSQLKFLQKFKDEPFGRLAHQTPPGVLIGRFGTVLLGEHISTLLTTYIQQVTITDISVSKKPKSKQDPMDIKLFMASVCNYSSCTNVANNDGRCVFDTLQKLLGNQPKCKQLAKFDKLVSFFGGDSLKNGVSGLEILAFCKHHFIPCRFLNIKNAVIAMNVVPRDKRKTLRPCLFFKIQNKHLYVIDNKEACSKLNHQIELCKKEGETTAYKSKTDMDLFGKKMPFDSVMYDDVKKLTLKQITEQCQDKFIICEEESLFRIHCSYVTDDNYCLDYNLRIGRDGSMKQFGDYSSNVIWISIPNYKSERDIYTKLFYQNGPIKNYSIMASRQAMILKSFDYGCEGSTFNRATQALQNKVSQVFWFDYDYPFGVNQSNLQALDFSKFYSGCLYASKYDFLIFNELCYPVEFTDNDKTESDCVYYINKHEIGTKYYSGRDYYYPELVEYWLDEGFITRKDITHKIKCSNTVPVKKFQTFIRNIYAIFKLDITIAKDLINKFIGCMRQSSYHTPKVYFTSEQEDVDVVVSEAKSVKVEEEADQFMVMDYFKTNLAQNYVTIHQQILDISAMKLSKLERHLEEEDCIVLKVKTDCLWFVPSPKSDIDLCLFDTNDEFANRTFALKYEETNELSEEVRLQFIPPENPSEGWSDTTPPIWSSVEETRDERECKEMAHRIEKFMLARESFYLGGGAGYGKSWLVDSVVKKYDVRILGTTHRAYLQVEGEDTLDAFKQKKPDLYKARILVDEISMSNPSHMMWLYRQKRVNDIQIILVGDFDQCTVDDTMKVFIDHPLFRELCDYNRIDMKFNKREIQTDGKPTIHKLVQKIHAGDTIAKDITKSSLTYTNLVWTHTTRHRVNSIVNEKFNSKSTNPKLDVAIEKDNTHITKYTKLICKRPKGAKTTSWSKFKKMGLYNNAFYLVESWDAESMVILKEAKSGLKKYGMYFDEQITIPIGFLSKYFHLGWAFTTHSVQGMSIDGKMTVCDVDMMERHDRSILYTAVSRCTKFEYLNFIGGRSSLPVVGYVYMITNTTNSRRYVGSTNSDIKFRWESHQRVYKQGGSDLYIAMNADGFDKFRMRLLKSYTLPQADDIREKERFWIDYYDTLENGYNQKTEASDSC